MAVGCGGPLWLSSFLGSERRLEKCTTMVKVNLDCGFRILIVVLGVEADEYQLFVSESNFLLVFMLFF